MNDIYKYTSYREYLSDFYKDKKAHLKRYSYRNFSEKAGMNSPNYLCLVISGKRNITLRNISNFVKGLELESDEASYFTNLVKIDLAMNFSEKAEFFEQLYILNKKKTPWSLKHEQYKVLSKWYYLVVREMVLLHDFENFPEWISKKLNNKITVSEAKEALDTLLKLNLLVEKDGKLIQTNMSVDTTNEIASMAIRTFHNSMINRSLKALQKAPIKNRTITALTVAISKGKIDIVKEKINMFKKDINDYLISDDKQSTVYQLNIQFFNILDS